MPTQSGQSDLTAFLISSSGDGMRYPNCTRAIFLSRQNRFVATVMLDGIETKVHIKNTGRLKELLIPGATVWLVDSGNDKRKYRYDLVSVEKSGRIVNIDSMAANRVFREYLESGGYLDGITMIRPEYVYGSSRLDFYFERGSDRYLLEVKGVTLESDGVYRFPDAPTERGTRHLNELIRAKDDGFHAAVCFVIQMDRMRCFKPNDATDPAFGQALREAYHAGVEIHAFCCTAEPDRLEISREIPAVL